MIDPISKYNFRASETQVPPEVHKTPEALKLKDACQQFESILWAQVWKKMRDGARAVSGSDRDRPWKQMEDLSLEMATDDLAASDNGPGLWRMLYDRMVGSLAARDESVSAEELSEEGPARVSSRP
nr:hypothetical protein [uncultured Fretibacterium sp.]